MSIGNALSVPDMVVDVGAARELRESIAPPLRVT